MRKLRYIFLCAALLTMVGALTAQDQVMFEYQGRVRVSGQPFEGTGRFKFAIMNTSATATLWSNDGTSENGSQPSAYLEATVNDGVFTIMIGDTTLGMQSINSSIFQSRTPLRLRTWFSDGTHGFEQLNPDSKLVNISLITVATGETDFTIYVNGTTGNDGNSGLALDKAKKTIQAGVNAVPRHLLCNVTVKVAPGVYRETVDVSGISGSGVLDNGDHITGKGLKIVGDETWAPALGGTPNVTITGCDDDGTSTPVRPYNLILHNNTTAEIIGLHMSYASLMGLRCETGVYLVKNCDVNHATYCGIQANVSSFVAVHQTKTHHNGYHGLQCQYAAMWLYNSASEYNAGGVGIVAGIQGAFQASDSTFRYNSVGCDVRSHSSITLTNCTVSGNTGNALQAYYMGYILRGTGVTVSGPTSVNWGGAIY